MYVSEIISEVVVNPLPDPIFNSGMAGALLGFCVNSFVVYYALRLKTQGLLT